MPFAAEAVLLGLSSGPACLASCGPVVAPWLAAEARGFAGTAGRLAVFLGGRLAGYLLFAALVWAMGVAVPLPARPRALVFGVVHVGLAGALAWYALRTFPRAETRGCTLKRAPRGIPVLIGFLTGLNLCPPFVAAAVRAAESASLPAAWGFFFLFFLGTLAWFPPLIVLGALRRAPAVATVARITLLMLAGYYAYLGVVGVGGFLLHAW